MKILKTLFFLLLCTTAFAQKNQLPEDVIASIKARIDLGLNPSIVIGIIDKDGPQYYSFGTKTVGGEPVDEHSIFEIGSITKTFTATLLADNIVKGKMKADDPIAKYLPTSVKVPTFNGGGQPITLGNLSDHTSSLPRMPSNMPESDPTDPAADYSVELMYTFLSSYALTREVGSEFEYSNVAVGLLGQIQALAAGTSYEEAITSVITSPLKMKETGITLSDKMKANLAVGHSMGVPVRNWDLNSMQGAGGIRSSVHDMLLFIAANLGLTKSQLSKAMELAHTPRHDKAGEQTGLGWFISQGSLGDVIAHNGGTGGYLTFAGFVKETGRGVVVLTNSGSSDAGDIGMHLLDPQSPLEEVKPDYSYVIKQMIDKDGPVGMEAKYIKVKAENPDKYYLDEDALNTLGYTYLSQEKVEAAIAVFGINVMEFPNSSNVYDSYGEALMKNGQQAEAIVNYKKSLELNPANSNAVDMLAKVGVEYRAEEVKVDETILQSYTGTYELAPGFNIVVTHDGSRLFAQATGQSQFELFATSDNAFYLKVVDARVVFSKNPEGVVSMTLHQGGQVMPGRRI
ncbi:MAG: serine hydrolase [Saprospiraceae bacterium]|nr:serine hydrolase [Saprospiraceae bacterium]